MSHPEHASHAAEHGQQEDPMKAIMPLVPIVLPVVGGVLDGCFVAKGDVAKWPVIGTIARLGRTVAARSERREPSASRPLSARSKFATTGSQSMSPL